MSYYISPLRNFITNLLPKFCLFCVLFSLAHQVVSAQNKPVFPNTEVLVSGIDLQVGAVYLVEDVQLDANGVSGDSVDALITIVDTIYGANLHPTRDLDGTFAHINRFEPKVEYLDDEAAIRFQIHFIVAGSADSDVADAVPFVLEDFTMELVGVADYEWAEVMVSSAYVLEGDGNIFTVSPGTVIPNATRFTSDGTDVVSDPEETEAVVSIIYRNVDCVDVLYGRHEVNVGLYKGISIGFLGQADYEEAVVTFVNDPPSVVSHMGSTVATVSTSSINLLSGASDPDNNIDVTSVLLRDPNDVFNFGKVGRPLVIANEGTYVLDNLGGVVFTPESSFVGYSTVDFTVNDDYAEISNSAEFTVAVLQNPIVLNSSDLHIWGTVFADVNLDASYDSGEPGQDSVELILYKDENGDNLVDSGDTELVRDTTDENGSFVFSVSSTMYEENVKDSFSIDIVTEDDGVSNCGSWYYETTSRIEFTGDVLEFHWMKDTKFVYRDFDLAGATSVQLSFYWQSLGLSSGEVLELEVSSDGGISYDNFASFGHSSASNFGFVNVDISSKASANTRIRFKGGSHDWEDDEYVEIDNLDISYTKGVDNYVMALNQISLPDHVDMTTSDVDTASFSILDNVDGNHNFGFASADVSVSVSDVVDTVKAGDGISYTYTFYLVNNGPTDATNVLVSDTWPSEYTQGVIGTPSHGTTGGTLPDFTWSLSSMANGQADSVKVSYTVPNTTVPAHYSNEVCVTSDTDPNYCNDTAVDVNVTLITDLDFGDAPSSYDVADTARHIIYLSPQIYLGVTAPDMETKPQSGDATTDDLVGTDDEDGVLVFPSLNDELTSYSLTASVLNSTGDVAYLSAYIDFDRNGLFDLDERADATISTSSASHQNIVLNWSGLGTTIDMVPGVSYLRLRLGSVESEVQQPNGMAIDGEVEDYVLYMPMSDPCAYDANATNAGNVLPCFELSDTIITYLDDLHYGADYFTLDVIQGLKYNIRTCMAGDESQSVNLSVYNESTKAFEAFSNSNTANDCSSDEHDVNLVFTASFSGKARVVLSSRYYACGDMDATQDIDLQIFVSGGFNTLDSEDDAGADSWIGHLYKGSGYSAVHDEKNLYYLGYYTEIENFDQNYGGATAGFDVYSDGEVRAQVSTEHFIARYKMNSTKKGLYVVDIGSDDGSRLTVDSLVVYSVWFNKGYSPIITSVLFSLAGESSLTLDYYENSGGNRASFQNLTLVFGNVLSNHLSQTVFLGNEGSAISGDVYGALPSGISKAGTGYQWAYCAVADSGNWIDISGATEAEYTPNSNASLFNTSGEYYIIRKASLSSVKNVYPIPYVAINESNVASLVVKALPTVSLVGGPTICAGDAAEFTIYGDSGYVVTFDGDTSGTVILGIGDSVTLLVHNVVADVILNLTQVSNAWCNATLLVSDTVGVLNSKAVAYDDFSDNAYGWADGSSLSDWTGGVDPLKYSVSDIPETLFYENDSSGIFVDGGSGCLFNNVGTSGSSQSKSVSRTPDNIMNKTFYISFLARFSMQPSSNWCYMGVGQKKINQDNGVVLGCLDNVDQLGGTFGDDGGKMDMVSGVKVDSMKTYFVVGKWTVGAGGVTDIDFWLNPTALKTPHARYHRSVTLGTVDADMTSIDIQSYFSETVYFDEIRYGFSWESVVPHHILVSSDDDNIITAGDEVTFTAYGGGDYAFYLNDVLVQGRSVDSSYVTSDLENKDTVSVIVYHENGCDVDTDEIVTFVLGDIKTDSVTQIKETSAVLYGSIPKAFDVVDYGFYISSDNDTSLLISGSAREVKPTSVSTGDLSDLHFSCSSDLLTNRSGYYFRAYLKDATGQYVYGNVQRFISEKRDFSLYLDGDGDCLIIDEQNTDSLINDWGDADQTFSVEFWLKNESVSLDKQVLLSNVSASSGYQIALDAGAIVLEIPIPIGTSVSSGLQITDQEWHHVAVSYNNGNALIFIDDSISSASITIAKPTAGEVNYFIGAVYNGIELEHAFHGHLDAMRFWNVALLPEQVSELLYDNIHEGVVANTVEGQGSGHVIPGLAWENLTASLGFNVKSTKEDDTSFPESFLYEDQTQLHQFPFFHNDACLGDDKRGFNAIAIGDATVSPYLPRIYWRYNAADSVWTDSNNWGAYAYPGQGVLAAEYLDVTTVDLVNDSAYCQYVIVGESTHNACVIGVIPPEVQVLVDRDNSIGTYYVDESAELTILKGVSPSLFSSRVEMSSGSIVIEGGAVEVFD